MSHIKERNGQPVATTYEFQFPQPKEKIPLHIFIYNSKDGTILGRTPSSWSKLFIFYSAFYLVLAGLFTICIQVLFQTLRENEPKWKLDSSLIGTNPGLGYRPLSEVTERGSLIKFDKTKPDQVQYWINLTNEFLEPYYTRTQQVDSGMNQRHCDFNLTPNGPGPNKVCAVEVNNLGQCSEKNGYGYIQSKPCIFLKLNKIFDWVPEFYDDINELPDEMPQDLKDFIKTVPILERKQVWISCKGHNKLDEENVGKISYYPSRGFASFYYPYKNTPGYLSPIVAVQFESPNVNILIGVECRAWAKNIIYNGSLRDRKGSVAFQLNIDTEVLKNEQKTT